MIENPILFRDVPSYFTQAYSWVISPTASRKLITTLLLNQRVYIHMEGSHDWQEFSYVTDNIDRVKSALALYKILDPKIISPQDLNIINPPSVSRILWLQKLIAYRLDPNTSSIPIPNSRTIPVMSPPAAIFDPLVTEQEFITGYEKIRFISPSPINE